MTLNLFPPSENKLFIRKGYDIQEKGYGTFDSPSGIMGWSSGYIPSDTGQPVSPFTSISIAAVYACCRALAEDTAKLKLDIKRRLPKGGAQTDPDHRLNKLLRFPNSYMNEFELKSFMVYSLSLQGNAYVYIERNKKNGDPIALWPILPQSCHPYVHHDGMIYYSLYHPMVKKRKCTMFDMIHIKNICLDHGFIGLSPISASQNVFGISIAAQSFAAKLYNQGTKLSGVLSTDMKMSPESITSMNQQWERMYSGLQNSNKIAVLPAGLKFTPISMTAEDSQLLETRRFSVEEVARIFRVPLVKIGHMTGSNFNTVEAVNQAYVDDSLMPICSKIEDAFSHKLFFQDETDGLFFKFNFDGLLRGDMKTRYESYQLGLLNGFLNQDEARSRENMPPLPNGEGKTFRVPLNTSPIDAIKPGSDLGKPTPPKPAGEQTEEPAK